MCVYYSHACVATGNMHLCLVEYECVCLSLYHTHTTRNSGNWFIGMFVVKATLKAVCLCRIVYVPVRIYM